MADAVKAVLARNQRGNGSVLKVLVHSNDGSYVRDMRD